KTTVYYATGEKYILSNYANGKLDGDYFVFSKNGITLLHETYNQGQLVAVNENIISKVEEYHPSLNYESTPILFDASLLKAFSDEKEVYAVAKRNEETRDSAQSKAG